MKIQKIERQSRRDFYAIFECEHCGHVLHHYGYDDDNFHQNVIPKMKCPKCNKTAPEDYQPLKTKYPSHIII